MATGTKIGIGVAVPVILILLAALAFLFLQNGKNRKLLKQKEMHEIDSKSNGQEQLILHEMDSEYVGELDGRANFELSNKD